jgi:hypothetical protein
MWFDRIDPRDPLQLTDGVYALLGRYYFLNNANLWFWLLYGNDNPKGWELLPTSGKVPEIGGRFQHPLFSGEIGVSYHHRLVGPDSLVFDSESGYYPRLKEDRIGLDGKWDVGPGIWVEEVLKHRQKSELLPVWENYVTLGVDYTFGIGNGLTATSEFFRLNAASGLFMSGNHASFTALNLTYPPGFSDMLSVILYYGWEDESLYRFVSWQHSYNKWAFYLMAYWNPEKIAIYRNPEGENIFAGKGIQFMIVFNH